MNNTIDNETRALVSQLQTAIMNIGQAGNPYETLARVRMVKALLLPKVQIWWEKHDLGDVNDPDDPRNNPEP